MNLVVTIEGISDWVQTQGDFWGSAKIAVLIS